METALRKGGSHTGVRSRIGPSVGIPREEGAVPRMINGARGMSAARVNMIHHTGVQG